MCRPVRLLPERLDRGRREQLRGSPGGELPNATRDGAREPLDTFGECLLDLALDIEVLVERVDQDGRDRGLNLLVGEQLGAGVNPGVGLEQLPVRPDRERREEEEERSDGDKGNARFSQRPVFGGLQRVLGLLMHLLSQDRVEDIATPGLNARPRGIPQSHRQCAVPNSWATISSTRFE